MYLRIGLLKKDFLRYSNAMTKYEWKLQQEV